MPCFRPLDAWQGPEGGPVRFKPFAGARRYLQVPCGQCKGCRLGRSLMWAVRCMHQAQMHDENCFITLTYSPANVPADGSLHKDDFQKFMKRLRKHLGHPPWLKFYMAGEYGEKNKRPHFHACLFGYDFPDKVFFKLSPTGERLYRSATLERLWLGGYSTIGAVTFESACYVARYVMKKITGKRAAYHYCDYDPQTGEVLRERLPEYNDMSRRPGIAAEWFKQFAGDVYPGDFVVMNGKKVRPPRYYDGAYEAQFPEDFAAIKQRRIARAAKHEANNTPERLKVREYVLERKLERLKRGIDDATFGDDA